MSRRILIAALVGGFIVLGNSQWTSAETLKLKLGTESSYPPFTIMAADGSMSGMEPELVRAMCKRMKAECEIVSMDFDALLPSLITGKIDGIVTQLNQTPERMEKVQFTRPIILNPEGFIVPKDWNKGYDNAAFKGVRVAVQKGSVEASYVTKNLPDAIPVYYEGPDSIRLDLMAGRVVAVFGAKLIWSTEFIDSPDGRNWKIGEPDFWTAGEKVGNSWAVQKGEEELVETMNKALDSLIADCTFTEIRKKYLSIQALPGEEPAKCL